MRLVFSKKGRSIRSCGISHIRSHTILSICELVADFNRSNFKNPRKLPTHPNGQTKKGVLTVSLTLSSPYPENLLGVDRWGTS